MDNNIVLIKTPIQFDRMHDFSERCTVKVYIKGINEFA